MSVRNILDLGVKELRSLARDPLLLILIGWAFTAAIHAAATAAPETLSKAAIDIVDEDRSPLSERIADAFYLPFFLPPMRISQSEMDARLDAGLSTFALDIPPGFQRDVLAGRSPAVQLNVDATRMSQAFTGSGYIHAIVLGEIAAFVEHRRKASESSVGLVDRVLFNPQLDRSWFNAIMELIEQITMLAIVLTGAALLREREHGTIDHLLVMPVTPFEIMTAKLWSMALVVLLGGAFSLTFVVRGLLGVPIEGSMGLFLVGVAMHLFAATSLGIVLGTVARSMPQFALLMMLVLLPLHMLSGAVTPRESMPEFVRFVMSAAPTTQFVELSQAILFRGAGIDVVWNQFVALAAIGVVLFGFALLRFRSTIGSLQRG